MSDHRDQRLKRRADELSEELIGWRRQLHQHPELGYQEQWTSEFVAERLRALNLDVRTGLAGTGVVGVLRAASARRPAVLLRADMDALPIQEVEGREYGSRIANRMHACGHDGHMTMLLGAATLVCEHKSDLDRDVIFCFQPAEEGGGGGRRMIEEGVLDLADVGTVYALHLWSPFAVGTVHVRPGPMMAGNDEFTACFRGRGGHGALPHNALDPIVAAAHAVTALQSVVARNIDPVEPAVVTVGMFHAGSAPNVIPDEAHLEGTMRSFDKQVRVQLRERVQEVLESSARGAGCALDYELTEGYPALINDHDSVELARREARCVFGDANVIENPPMAAAEDFAYFLEQRPGAFLFVGAGNRDRGITAPHHSPRFDIDEAALSRGAELLARLAHA